ncbi:MAG: hypothetical protein PHC49_12015 [Desulfuromonadaceae bacterium]|nr:hypothetical protein [Desulfuromonadaceae bacterium]
MPTPAHATKVYYSCNVRNQVELAVLAKKECQEDKILCRECIRRIIVSGVKLSGVGLVARHNGRSGDQDE